MRFGFGHPGESAGFCQHHSCREEQALELAFMAGALNRPDLRALADQAHQSTVRCRHQPRKGAVRAPLPTQEE